MTAATRHSVGAVHEDKETRRRHPESHVGAGEAKDARELGGGGHGMGSCSGVDRFSIHTWPVPAWTEKEAESFSSLSQPDSSLPCMTVFAWFPLPRPHRSRARMDVLWDGGSIA